MRSRTVTPHPCRRASSCAPRWWAAMRLPRRLSQPPTGWGWKDANGKRRTKSISTGLPGKGNKKRAESLLRQTQKEFNPETMQQVGDLSVPEYLTRWLRESVMNLSSDTYGRYAYDMGRVIIRYFSTIFSWTG